MNRKYIPLLAAIVLALGLFAAMNFTPIQPVEIKNAAIMPGLDITRLESGKAVTWQPRLRTVTVINFFASWCVPCLAEHPQIQQLSRIDGIEVHGIAWNDKAKNIRAWLDKHGNPFTTVWLDTTGRAAITAGIRGVPESYVVDKWGKVRLHIQGSIPPDRVDELKTLLMQLRDEESDDAPAAH